MEFEHTLVITQNSEIGSLNEDTGIFTPSEDSITIYDGLVDAQEVSNRSGKKFTGSDLKTQKTMLDIFLEDESNIMAFEIEQRGTLTRNGVSVDVSVTKIRQIDSVIEVVVV